MHQQKSNQKSFYVQRTMDMLERLTSFADSMGIYGSLTLKLRAALAGPMDFSSLPTHNAYTNHEAKLPVWPSSTLPPKLRRDIALKSMTNLSKSSSHTNQSLIGIDKTENQPLTEDSSPSSWLGLDVAGLKARRDQKAQEKQVLKPEVKGCILGCGVRYSTVVGNTICPPCAGRSWDDPLYKGQIFIVSESIDRHVK